MISAGVGFLLLGIPDDLRKRPIRITNSTLNVVVELRECTLYGIAKQKDEPRRPYAFKNT
jgi:hypothetical protein